jgi:SAM-dependent methyltransferase
LLARLCPACGGIGKEKFSANIKEEKISPSSYSSRKRPELMHYALMECQSCRTLFVERVPDLDGLIENYVVASFDSRIESEYAAKTYGKYLNRLDLVRNKRILDIGCGDGTFLEKATSLGAESVLGIEPSQGALESAGEVRNSIRTIPVEQCDYQFEFDLVTCFQTLEHLVDPKTVLSKMCSAAISGGYVAVVCHNRLSLVNRLMGRRSPIFDIEHLQMFSVEGLEKIFQSTNLEIVVSKQILNSYPLGYWLRLFPMPKIMKDFFESRRDSFLMRIPVSLFVGNRLVIAQKGN